MSSSPIELILDSGDEMLEVMERCHKIVNFKKLVEIKTREIRTNTIISYPEIEDFCYRPYPNHPKGCPNTHKCEWLNIPNFETILEYGEYKHFYLIYAEFEYFKYWLLRLFEAIKTHALDYWTSSRLKCLIYWQNSVKKLLSEFINTLPLAKPDYILGCGYGLKIKTQKYVGSMENSCINVFTTCKLNGIKLEIRPKDTIHLVCLLCAKKPVSFKRQKQLTLEV